MNGANVKRDNSRHSFVFTSKDDEYLLICLMNSLPTIVTPGIHGPWALIERRRYVYQHMTLRGQPFSYRGTGGVTSVNILLTVVVYLLSISCFAGQHFVLGLFLPTLLICGIPYMIVKDLQHQTNMTSLGDIRFGFNYSMMRAWWIMPGLPILLVLVFRSALYLTAQVTISTGGLFLNLVTLSLLSAVGLGVVYGITYSKWMPLLGNNVTSGIHESSIQVGVKECIRGCILTVLATVPFVTVTGIMTAPVFQQLMMMAILGGSDAGGELVLQYYPQIVAPYLLYFVAVLVFASYLYITLRDLFLNNLALADETIRFYSSITAIGMLLRMLAVLTRSSITRGLTCP